MRVSCQIERNRQTALWCSLGYSVARPRGDEPHCAYVSAKSLADAQALARGKRQLDYRLSRVRKQFEQWTALVEYQSTVQWVGGSLACYTP